MASLRCIDTIGSIPPDRCPLGLNSACELVESNPTPMATLTYHRRPEHRGGACRCCRIIGGPLDERDDPFVAHHSTGSGSRRSTAALDTYDSGNQDLYVSDRPILTPTSRTWPEASPSATANWAKTFSTSCGAGIAYNPYNDKLYVSCSTNTVVVMKCSTGSIVTTVTVGSGRETSALLCSENHDMYVANGDSVSVISPQEEQPRGHGRAARDSHVHDL